LPGGGAGQRGRRREEGPGVQREIYERDIRSNPAVHGTSVFIRPENDEQLRHFGFIAHIYFPTLATQLDADDERVLGEVKDYFMTSDPVMLRAPVRFLVWGTADWRRADNDSLAQERARSVRRWLDTNIGDCAAIDEDLGEPGPGEGAPGVMEHGTECRPSPWYQADSQGRGVAGTPRDGLTPEELNEFRAAHVLAVMGRVAISEEIRRPPPDPLPPLRSTHFKIRILQSFGGDVPLIPSLSGNYAAMEIVDTTNNMRLIFEYIGWGAGWSFMPVNASRTSAWQAFTTTAQLNLIDFEGPVLHTSAGIAFRRGATVDTFRLFGPAMNGADSIYLVFSGTWEEAVAGGFGADFGGLEPVVSLVGWNRVPPDYTTNPDYPLPRDFTFSD